MRLMLSVAAIVVMVGATALGQQAAATDEQAPTDAAVIDMCGARLAKLFAQFGNPDDVFAYRADKPENDGVDLEYGEVAFRVRNKIVDTCFFYSSWKGTIKGIKIGDTRASVLKALGSKHQIFKNQDGVEDFGWDLKANDAILWFVFDEDNKVTKASLELN